MGLSVDGLTCQGHLEVGVIPSALLSLWLFPGCSGWELVNLGAQQGEILIVSDYRNL